MLVSRCQLSPLSGGERASVRCLMAKWGFVYGDDWGVVDGEAQGATQAATPMVPHAPGSPPLP